MSSSKLTHFDNAGQAHMVDVAEKPETSRRAIACGRITMQSETLDLIVSGRAGKGDVLAVARLAGIQASKRTGELIPLCHPVALTRVTVEFEVVTESNAIDCTACAECVGRTGVEMEALTAASIALLTIYDMCKAVDRGMSVGPLHLLEKSGGKSGHWIRSQR